jgi:threonine dehydratase
MAEAGARGVTVSDDEVRLAMWWCFTHMKLVVEPGGAAAVAACLFRKIDVRGRRVLTLVSGANVDTKTFASVLMADLPQRGLQ